MKTGSRGVQDQHTTRVVSRKHRCNNASRSRCQASQKTSFNTTDRDPEMLTSTLPGRRSPKKCGNTQLGSYLTESDYEYDTHGDAWFYRPTRRRRQSESYRCANPPLRTLASPTPQRVCFSQLDSYQSSSDEETSSKEGLFQKLCNGVVRLLSPQRAKQCSQNQPLYCYYGLRPQPCQQPNYRVLSYPSANAVYIPFQNQRPYLSAPSRYSPLPKQYSPYRPFPVFCPPNPHSFYPRPTAMTVPPRLYRSTYAPNHFRSMYPVFYRPAKTTLASRPFVGQTNAGSIFNYHSSCDVPVASKVYSGARQLPTRQYSTSVSQGGAKTAIPGQHFRRAPSTSNNTDAFLSFRQASSSPCQVKQLLSLPVLQRRTTNLSSDVGKKREDTLDVSLNRRPDQISTRVKTETLSNTLQSVAQSATDKMLMSENTTPAAQREFLEVSNGGQHDSAGSAKLPSSLLPSPQHHQQRRRKISSSQLDASANPETDDSYQEIQTETLKSLNGQDNINGGSDQETKSRMPYVAKDSSKKDFGTTHKVPYMELPKQVRLNSLTNLVV